MIILKFIFVLWLIICASLSPTLVDHVIAEVDSKGYIALLLFPLLNDYLRNKHINKVCIIIIDILTTILFLPAVVLYYILIGFIISVVVICANVSKFF